jgi:hypothetical protein
MLSTKELFEINPKVFIKMNYVDVLLFKKKRSQELIKELFELDYMTRDYHRIDQLSKTIKNMDKLLNELETENKCTTMKKRENLLILFTNFVKIFKQITSLKK